MPYDTPAETTDILIQEVEMKMYDNNTQYALKTDKGKFKFYDKKKDGSETAAYKVFRDNNIRAGMRVTVGYASEEKVYAPTNKKYTDNRILFFSGESKTPAVQQPAIPVVSPPQQANDERLDKMQAQIDKLNAIVFFGTEDANIASEETSF